MLKKILKVLKKNVKVILIKLNLLSLYIAFKYSLLSRYRFFFPFDVPNTINKQDLLKLEKFDLNEIMYVNQRISHEYRLNISVRHSVENSLDRANHFIKQLNPYALHIDGASVADIGCGRGSNSLYFALSGATNISAFDMDNTNFMKFSDRVIEDKIASMITFHKLNIVDDDDVTDFYRQFDLVVMHNTFEHLSDPLKALRNIAVITKPGGYFLNKFGPIFYSPEGPHVFNEIDIPYYHHLFPDEVIYKYLEVQDKKNNLDPLNRNNKWRSIKSVTGRSKDPYPTVNRYSVKKYYNLFRSQNDWKIVFIKKGYNFRSSWALKIFPEKLKKLGPAELFTSDMTVLLKRL